MLADSAVDAGMDEKEDIGNYLRRLFISECRLKVVMVHDFNKRSADRNWEKLLKQDLHILVHG